MNRRSVVLSVLLLAALVLAAYLSVPQDTGQTGPGGTAALERFLRRMGAQVDSGEGPPRNGTFVLLSDLRSEKETEAILSWVEGGGRVVVAEPDSPVLTSTGIGSQSPGGSGSASVLSPGCVAPEAAGVGAIAVSAADPGFVHLPATALGCFAGRHDRPFLVVLTRGRGTIVGLGGRSPFTNEFLRSEDNAVMALRVLASNGPVVFGPPLPASFGQGKGLWESLPSAARSGALVLGLAAVLYALARGRRLGRPVEEDPLTVVPASRLAHAAANLYRNARAADHAGVLLRDGVARRLAARLGLPDVDPEAVGRALEAEGLRDAPGVLSAAGPRNDAELVELGRELARIEAAAGALR